MKYLMILTGLVCLSFMLLPACAPEPVQEAEPVTEEAANTEADVAAIKTVDKEFLAAFNAGDVDAMVALSADDVVLMPPGQPAVTGREALASWLTSFKETFTSEHIWNSEEIVVFGDWAFSRGTASGTNTPKAGGDPIQFESKYIWILKRQSDDSWKYARTIFNWTNPPTE